MNSIQLTEQHRSMLLEMCKALFPEYVSIYIEDANGDNVVNSSDIPIICFFTDDKHDFSNQIHWFEFVVKHLLFKLKTTYYRYTRYLMEEISGLNPIHIVEYCYEQFKRL